MSGAKEKGGLPIESYTMALYQRRKILTRKGFPFWAGCDELLSKVVYVLIMRRRDPGVLHLRI